MKTLILGKPPQNEWIEVCYCGVGHQFCFFPCLAANAAFNWTKNAKQQNMMKQVNTVCKTTLYMHMYVIVSILSKLYTACSRTICSTVVVSIRPSKKHSWCLKSKNLIAHCDSTSSDFKASDHSMVPGSYLALRPQSLGCAGSPSCCPSASQSAPGGTVIATAWNHVHTCIHNWISYIYIHVLWCVCFLDLAKYLAWQLE